jgi:hypothetical protein
MKLHYLIIVLFALSFSACSDDDKECDCGNPSDSYLPLRIGNYWEFESLPEPSKMYMRTEVTRTTDLDGSTYYELISTSQVEDENANYRDTTYYRVDSRGYVYTRKKNVATEINIMRLFGNNGDKWTSETSYDEDAVITLSVIDDLAIGEKNLDDCKAYSFDIEQWADEEYTIYLAPGIGFVKNFSGWGFGSRLTKASVNGREYTF